MRVVINFNSTALFIVTIENVETFNREYSQYTVVVNGFLFWNCFLEPFAIQYFLSVVKIPAIQLSKSLSVDRRYCMNH